MLGQVAGGASLPKTTSTDVETSLGRLIADPDLPRRLVDGREDDGAHGAGRGGALLRVGGHRWSSRARS